MLNRPFVIQNINNIVAFNTRHLAFNTSYANAYYSMKYLKNRCFTVITKYIIFILVNWYKNERLCMSMFVTLYEIEA